MDLADKKINEINREIQKLEKTKEVLKIRKEQLAVCRRVKDVLIEVKELPEERSRVIPFDIKEENLKDLFMQRNVGGLNSAEWGSAAIFLLIR